MFTTTEKKYMMLLGNRITPPSWNVHVPGIGSYVDAPGTLNIYLFPFESPDVSPGSLGGVSTIINIGRGVSSVNLWLYSHQDSKDTWRTTLIHELAHVGVMRFVTVWKKLHRAPQNHFFILEIPSHGPLFQRCYTLLINRIFRVRGIKLELEEHLSMERELEFYLRVVPDSKVVCRVLGK